MKFGGFDDIMIRFGLSLVHEKCKLSLLFSIHTLISFKNVLVDQMFDIRFITNENLFAFGNLKFH